MLRLSASELCVIIYIYYTTFTTKRVNKLEISQKLFCENISTTLTKSNAAVYKAAF